MHARQGCTRHRVMQLELQARVSIAGEREQLAEPVRFRIGHRTNAQQSRDIALHLLRRAFYVVGSAQHNPRALQQLTASGGQVTFNIGADVDKAALNVNNRVKQAEARLPQEVRRQGVTVEKGSSAFLQVLAFYSPDGRFDDLFTSNYVTLNVLDELKRLPSTTNVQIFGAKDYAMRIWLRPDRLAQLKLTTGDVARAINEQNSQFAAGKVGQAPYSGEQELAFTITTQGRLADVAQFESIIVRSSPDGSTVRVRDVARVELGSRDYDFIGRYNGREATLVGIFLQPGANALEVAESVKTAVDGLAARFPEGLTYSIPYDTTRFVDVSIHEVVITLAIAVVLVLLVVFLFLQSWRATLIPDHRSAGIFARHVRRAVDARLLDQHADVVRHGAGDRHRR